MFSLADLGVTFEKTSLSNNIPVLLFDKKGSPVTFFIAFPVGSYNDLVGKRGITHFLEHLILKSEMNGSDINIEIEKLGGHINGFTWLDVMALHATFGDDSDLDRVSEIFATALNDFGVSDKNFELERDVVLQELQMAATNPEILVYELNGESLYPGTSYQYPIIGTAKDLKSITQSDVKKTLDEMLQNRPTILITGDLNHKAVLASLEKHFGGLKSSRQPATTELITPLKTRNVVRITKDNFVNALYSFRVCDYKNTDTIYLDFISKALSGSFTSILLSEIRKKLGLVYTIGSENTNFARGGDFSIVFGTENRNLPKLINKLEEIIDSLRNNGLTNEQMEFTKKYFSKSIKMRYEKVFNIALHYYFDELFGPSKYSTLEDFIQGTLNVTNEDVKRVASKYFVEEKFGITAVGNLTDESAPFLKGSVRV